MSEQRKRILEKLNNIEEILTVEDASIYFKLPKSWFYERTRLGKGAIPHMKMGKYVRFFKADLIRYFKELN